VVTIVFVRRGLLLFSWFRGFRSRNPAELLDRTEPDAIGLAERTIDGAGFGDAHLGAVDHGRDVGRIGIAVTDEAARAG
jgi:hypothetical protein